MDTSETYIKMCEKAREIQELWKPEKWDYLYCRDNDSDKIVVLSGYATDSGVYGHGYLEGDECDYHSYHWLVSETRDAYLTSGRWERFKKDHVWLPRQDQLQEMMGFTKVHCNQIHELSHWGEEQLDDVTYWESWEQLWLAFVMREKYNKVWNGEDWVKE